MDREELIYPGSDGVGFLESSGRYGDLDAPQVPAGDASSGHRAGSIRDACEPARPDLCDREATVYNWTKQDEIDRGEREGLSTDQAIELMAAKRRIKQLEIELAVARKVNEVFLRHDLAPKVSTR